MGFFGGSASIGGYVDDLLNESRLNTYEGMSIMEANYAAMAETEMNWNAIMEAAAENEMRYFAETGEEYVYNEASGFFDKVSEFFKKIWEKIKGIFKKFMVMLGSAVNDDKVFVNKYRETITRNIKNIPSNAQYKGYDNKKFRKGIDDSYTAINDGTKFSNILPSDPSLSNVPSDFTSDNYDSSDVAEKVRGWALGETDAYTEKEFKDKYYEKLHGGDDTPENCDLTSSEVTYAIAELSNAKETRKNADKAYKGAEKIFKDIIKKAETLEKNSYKEKSTDDDKTKNLTGLSRAIAAAKQYANAKQTMCSMYLSAVKEFYNQQKKICVKCATFREVKEGAYVEHFSENAFGGVNLI